ncbi:MAG: FCD domain-containing protein [Deltaproteobacteria bacterium]|nr:FCD domain-containing protein [Deltaproteobacteria bacterium]
MTSPTLEPADTDIAARLRNDILGADLPPASRLRLMDLTDRYGAPAGKVREALLQLASEGLIAFEPKRGFALLPISLRELEDVTKLRIDLETRALRDAIACGDDMWETHIISALHLLTKIEARSLQDRRALDPDWTRKHRQFHRALLAACPSSWTLRFCETLSDHAERYRRFSIATRAYARDIHAEHKAIADAAIARQADKACELLAAHYSATAEAVAANKAAFAQRAGG